MKAYDNLVELYAAKYSLGVNPKDCILKQWKRLNREEKTSIMKFTAEKTFDGVYAKIRQSHYLRYR